MPIIAQVVHVEDVLDEDFAPGAHPECFTKGSSETPRGNIHSVAPLDEISFQSPSLKTINVEPDRSLICLLFLPKAAPHR